MRKIDTSKLSDEECWAVQINGLQHCETCKFTGLSAFVGKEIKRTGKNKKGYSIGEYGLSE
jgi:hypothetical protein